MELEPKGQPGDSQSLKFTTTTLFDKEGGIRMASPERGVVSTFSDELVVYVGIDYNLPL